MPIQTSPLWPTGSDALILRAVMFDGDRALAAWREWRDAVDYATLDFAQRRLVPLLYTKLRALGVTDPILAHYRNDTRIFWIRNQELLSFAADEIERLEALGIPTLAMKGVPLAASFYDNPGLRPMSDTDVLVQPADAIRAIESFFERGWSSTNEFIATYANLEQIVAVREGLNLREPGGDKEIDLHWKLLKCSAADTAPMWASSREVTVNGRTLRTLCPTDLLLLACAQAAEWNVVRPIRWLPDAAAIIAHADIDWDRLVAQAERMQIVETIRDALDVLQEFLELELPAAPLERLRALRSSWLTRMDYRISSRAQSALIGRPLLRYLRYLRVGKPQGLRFDEYLRYMWGTDSLTRSAVHGLGLVWKEMFGQHGKPP
jgi:hypothetical protein